MEFQFENIKRIKDEETFDSVRIYFEDILSFATAQGLLKENTLSQILTGKRHASMKLA